MVLVDLSKKERSKKGISGTKVGGLVLPAHLCPIPFLLFFFLERKYNERFV